MKYDIELELKLAKIENQILNNDVMMLKFINTLHKRIDLLEKKLMEVLNDKRP